MEKKLIDSDEVCVSKRIWLVKDIGGMFVSQYRYAKVIEERLWRTMYSGKYLMIVITQE